MTLYDTFTTILDLSAIGVPPYSSRGMSQSYEPISASQNMRRTVNGTLLDLSAPQFQKYMSTITGGDQLPPALDGVFPGQELTVDCLAYMSYKTDGGSPQREVVPGSSRVEGEFTLYRPRLQVRVVAFNVQEDEWGAVVSWTLQLEEI